MVKIKIVSPLPNLEVLIYLWTEVGETYRGPIGHC
jgi:hypothetical protein